MNIRIRPLRMLFGLVVSACFIAAVAVGMMAKSELGVGGPIYDEIARGKDLVADILPPPAYLIEAFLTVEQIDAGKSSLAEGRAELAALKSEFEARMSFWDGAPIPQAIRQALIHEALKPGQRFWSLVEDRYLPARERSDLVASAAALLEIEAAYDEHHRAIHRVVDLALAENGMIEQRAAQASNDYSLLVWLGSGIAFAINLAGLLFLSRWLVTPLLNLRAAMEMLTSGNLAVTIPAVQRRDEIGEMARALEVLGTNEIEAQKLREERLKDDARMKEAQSAALRGMAAKIESETGTAVSDVAERTEKMTRLATEMTHSASRVSESSQAVAAAAEQALANVNAVSAATEECTASVRDIANQLVRAKQVTAETVETGKRTHQTIESLSASVGKIGDVANIIASIAGQTNLLALNATIEAARAGEAGKGFAVVAGEVKSLSTQTAQSTEDIRRQIEEIQSATQRAIQVVSEIGNKIVEVDNISTTIAAAIEQQSAAMSEIARNVSETSSAARDVAGAIAAVSNEARSTGEGARQLNDGVNEVAESITSLSGTIVRTIRTSSKDVDRRRKPRFRIDLKATTRGQVATEVLVSNLSEGGAFLQRADGFRPGHNGILVIENAEMRFHVLSTPEKGVAHVKFTDDPNAAFLAVFRRLTAGKAPLNVATGQARVSQAA
ncbi:MAG: HAMP domain-containing protein [Alphaproteobacteria bacterium]|nr:HAMP domain-containing protein [Alphaproteobacteria bacterium]